MNVKSNQGGIHTKEGSMLLPKATTRDLFFNKQNPSLSLCTFIILVLYAVIVFPKRLITPMTTHLSCNIDMRLVLPMYGIKSYLATCTGLDTALEVVLLEVRPTHLLRT